MIISTPAVCFGWYTDSKSLKFSAGLLFILYLGYERLDWI